MSTYTEPEVNLSTRRPGHPARSRRGVCSRARGRPFPGDPLVTPRRKGGEVPDPMKPSDIQAFRRSFLDFERHRPRRLPKLPPRAFRCFRNLFATFLYKRRVSVPEPNLLYIPEGPEEARTRPIPTRFGICAEMLLYMGFGWVVGEGTQVGRQGSTGGVPRLLGPVCPY